MSKSRKLFLVLFVCMLTLVVLLTSACGGNSDTNTNTGTNGNTNTSTEGDNSNTNTESNTNTDTEDDGPVYYFVYVEDQNGKPVEGVNLQICKDGLCLNAKITDANGMAKFEYFEMAEFKVQFNSVPDDCIMPSEEYYPFPEGETTTILTIQKQQTYTVTASDMHGNKLSNILVELYNAENDELVDSFVTEANGRAVFKTNPAEYYAVVKHAFGNGAYVLTGADDGIISFEKTKNVQVQFVVLEDDIDYTLSLENADQIEVEGAEVKLYNEDFELVGTEIADETGVVTFNVPNGTYYAVATLEGHYIKAVTFIKDGKTSEAALVEDVTPGIDRDHPIIILGNIDITVNAGEQVWYYIPNAEGKKLEITSETAIVRQSATNHTANENGVIAFDLMPGADGSAAIRISTSLTEGSDNITGKIYEPGSEKTPFELDIDNAITNGMTVMVAENGKVYYTFVASQKGTITATTETENAVITINGNPFKKSVNEGDTVVICFYTEAWEGDDVIHPEAEIEATFTYELVKASYKVTTIVENQKASVTIELYEKIGEQYTKIATATTDKDGNYIFDNLTQTADYYLKVVCANGYETQTEYEPFGDENELTVYVNHVRDGSQAYPFLIDAGEENSSTTEVTLDGTAKWYTLFYIQGAQISIDNGEATVKIYTVTSVDGEPSLIATLTGDALMHTLTSDLGTTARVLISVEGEAGTVNLSLVTPEVE